MADWQRLCKARDLRVQGDTVRVEFPSGRTQTVRIDATADGYRLRSTVIGGQAVNGLLDGGDDATSRDLLLRILQRNRGAPLVGFKWDRDNRIITEAHAPFLGLTATELQLYIRTVAREADRLEHLLTGQDRN